MEETTPSPPWPPSRRNPASISIACWSRPDRTGLPAGQIGEQLGLPSATLAFHLKELKNAGLAHCTRNGRSLIYAAEYPTMNALLSISPRTAAAVLTAHAHRSVIDADANVVRARKKERLNHVR